MANVLRSKVNQVSGWIASFVSHPVVQILIFVGSVTWLALGGSMAALAATTTIGGFILTQMVLNQQRIKDDALHLKIDELITTLQGPRDEVSHTEEETNAEIEKLRKEQSHRT